MVSVARETVAVETEVEAHAHGIGTALSSNHDERAPNKRVTGADLLPPEPVSLGTVLAIIGTPLVLILIVVGLGSMLGAMLEASGGAQVLADRLIRRFGEERAPLAMGLTGLIFGIPVFFDIGIFVLAPLVYVAAIKSKRSILIYCLPLLAGLSVMHAFLPPHPGPVAAAGLLNVDLGWVIIMGLACGIPAWIVGGYFFSNWIGERIYIPVPGGGTRSTW
jgi:gluconate:H+ symporter, GntP family